MLSGIVISGILAPALAAALLLVAIWRFRAFENAWGAPVALAAAYVAGHVGVLGSLPWPPTEATQWIAYFALLTAIVGVLEAVAPGGTVVTLWVRRGVVAMVLTYLTLRPLTVHSWSTSQSVLTIAGVGLLVLGSWWAIQFSAVEQRSPAGWIDLLVAVSAAAVAMASTGSLALGQIAGVLAAALGGSMVVAALSGDRRLESFAVPVVGVVLAGQLICAAFYSDLPKGAALLLAFGILGSRLATRVMPATSNVWLRLVVRLLFVALPAGAAIAWGWASAPQLEPYLPYP